MKSVALAILFSLVFTAQPALGSNSASQSVHIPKNTTLVASITSTEPECTGVLKRDCGAKKAYKRINRLADSDADKLIKEYRRYFLPLLAKCYKNANFMKVMWERSCPGTYGDEKEFVVALFEEPAQIGAQSFALCMPHYKKLLMRAYSLTPLGRNETKPLNRFLKLMNTESYLGEYPSVIPGVMLLGAKNKFSGRAHDTLTKISTREEMWIRAGEINRDLDAGCT